MKWENKRHSGKQTNQRKNKSQKRGTKEREGGSEWLKR